jgi:hypothetical protein
VPYLHCYCSICRKTAGGGGYTINLGARRKSLKVEGRDSIGVYRARIEHLGRLRASGGRRHFCRRCASCLWLYDPAWPEYVHPFASSIDTLLPKPPERVHMMLGSRANWPRVPRSRHDIHFEGYPEESLEAWHRRHGLLED